MVLNRKEMAVQGTWSIDGDKITSRTKGPAGEQISTGTIREGRLKFSSSEDPFLVLRCEWYSPQRFRQNQVRPYLQRADISLLSTLGERLSARMRTELFKSIISQDITFFDTHKTGEIVDRLEH